MRVKYERCVWTYQVVFTKDYFYYIEIRDISWESTLPNAVFGLTRLFFVFTKDYFYYIEIRIDNFTLHILGNNIWPQLYYCTPTFLNLHYYL